MPDPIVFKNQDREFGDWARNHPRGRVINVPTLMIHTVHCTHIGDWGTTAAKACADGPNADAELRRWAQATRGKRPLICDTCGGDDV